jgi:hypothetical protein
MNRKFAVAPCASLIMMLFAAGPAASQQDDQAWLRNCERQAERSSRATVCEVRNVTTQLAAGALRVDAGQNGGVSVSGQAVNDVRVSARIQAHAAADRRAREIADAVSIHAAGGQVHADGIRTADGEGWSVSFHLTVPQRADLDLMAVNGPLAVRDVAGRIRAVTRNGPLALENLAGDVHARAENGPLTVRLSGSRWDGAGLDAETRNGPLSLVVPDGYSAELETGTINGPFSSRIPLTIVGRLPQRGHMRTTLGSGGAPIRVVTTNGPATVSQR